MRWSFQVIIPLLTLVRAYKHYFTESLPCDNKPFLIVIDSTGQNSAAILKATKEGGYTLNRTCFVKVATAKDYGILLDLNFVELYKSDLGKCVDRLEISYNQIRSKAYCDVEAFTLMTLTSEPEENAFTVAFITEQRGQKVNTAKYNFAITFTAYHRSLACGDNEFDCGHSKCIFFGFHCDTINNCEGTTDENECVSPGGPKKTTTIIVLVFVAVGLLVLVCFLYSTSKCRKLICSRLCSRRRDSREGTPQTYSPPDTTPLDSEVVVEVPLPQVVIKHPNAVASDQEVKAPPPQVRYKSPSAGANAVAPT